MYQIGWYVRAMFVGLALAGLNVGCQSESLPPPPKNWPNAEDAPSVSVEPTLTGDVAKDAEELLNSWEPPTTKIPLRRVMSTKPFPAVVREAVFSQNGQRLAARFRDGQAVVIDAKSGKTLWSKKMELEDLTVGRLIALSSDGRRIALNLQGRKVEVWDCDTNQLVVERAERNPIHFVGLNHTAESFFICEVPLPQTSASVPLVGSGEGIEVAPPVEISFTDGESTVADAEGMRSGVIAMAPIVGGQGYLVLDAFNQLLYWNPTTVPSISKTLTKGTAFAKVNETWLRANRTSFMAHVEGALLVGRLSALGLAPEPTTGAQADSVGPSDDEEVASLPTISDLTQKFGNSSRIWGRIDSVNGRCFTEGVTACDVDFAPFLMHTKAPDDRYFRDLDVSPDGKFVVAYNKDLANSTLSIYELGNIPEHPVRRVQRWAHKAMADNNYKLIDAVLAAAQKREKQPKWGDLPVTWGGDNTPWRQIVQGVLENQWTPKGTTADTAELAHWKENQTALPPDTKALADKAEALSKQRVDYPDNAPAKELVEYILNGTNVDARAIAAFVEMCNRVTVRRDIIKNVAARAAEICEPKDKSLELIANALMEFAHEEPDVPLVEATVGFIEAVANAEMRRNGVDAGDVAYATFTVRVSNAGHAGYMTGGESARLDEYNKYYTFEDYQRERSKLASHYVDYERLVRGLTLYLTKTRDVHVAKFVLELAYASSDKQLAQLAIPSFEETSRWMRPPPEGFGNVRPYIDWAKSP